MTRTMLAAAVCLGLLGGFARAEEKPKPEPKEDPKPVFDKASDMPLELYKEVHQLLEIFYGVAPANAPKMTKAEAKQALEAKTKEHKAALLKALHSEQTIHRELAAMALEYCGDAAGTIKALSVSVKKDPDSEVRLASAGTLSNLQDAAAVEALIAALEDGEETVRGVAIAGLAKVKDNRACDPLLRVLRGDEKPAVRARAAAALGAIDDKSTVMALLQALDAEQDQRVRMAIASTVRKVRGDDTPATEGVPDTQEHTGVLSKLGKDMRDVEEKLRNERHDRAVQVDQKAIEEQLSKIIEQIEKMQSQASSSSSQKKQQQQNQQQSGQQPGQPGSPSSPLQDSKLGGQTPPGALNAAEVSGKQADWAKLPPAMRDEMINSFRKEIPPRWQLRLEKYWESLAAEEAKAGQ